jgi:hypothetical protein
MSHSHDNHAPAETVSPTEARVEIVLAILVAAIFLELPIHAPEAPANLLSLLLEVPLLGALAVLFIPRQWTAIIRRFSLAVMVIELWISAWLFHGDYSGSAYQFTQDVEWIPALGIRYSVGVDGISYWLVLLTTVLTPISLYVSFNSVTTKIKEYAFAFLLLEVGMIGAFVSLDRLPLLRVLGADARADVPHRRHLGRQGPHLRGAQVLPLHDGGQLLMLVAILYVVAHLPRRSRVSTRSTSRSSSAWQLTQDDADLALRGVRARRSRSRSPCSRSTRGCPTRTCRRPRAAR